MSVFNPQKRDPRELDQAEIGRLDGDQDSPKEKKGGHGHWMMIACCIPMLAIAIVLVATGVVGAGFIVAALLCTAVMAMMMVGMSGAGGGEGRGKG